MMSHPTKKQRLEDGNDHAANDNAVLVTAGNLLASFGALSVDLVANIFAFLVVEDIMRSRRINKKSREAVRITTVPLTKFRVNCTREYNAMAVMMRAMPNLQQLEIDDLGNRRKWSDGEDPDEEWAAFTDEFLTHDFEIISNFTKLRVLEIRGGLNGRYPFIFNSFPLLQKLSISYRGWCRYLKWDLEMLAGLPILKELNCEHNEHLSGHISSLGVLKDTLENLTLQDCPSVEGNFMDLADFHNLKELVLEYTAVTGDIRDIGENDFSSLERLTLPKSVYGGRGCQLQRISEATDLMRAVYLFKKQRPALKMEDWHQNWYGELSRDSPDWYELDGDFEDPPFCTHFVQAGSRLGYRWADSFIIDHPRYEPCEVNWLDPEPESGSSDYEEYIEELQKIERKVGLYRGYRQPPTEEEYHGLIGRRLQEEGDY
jgi:hypothetical protein